MEGVAVSVLVVLVLLPFFAILAWLAIKNLLYIAGPNEVLIFSGGNYQLEKRESGYQLLKGGRRMRIPIFERVDRIDLTNMTVEEYSAGVAASTVIDAVMVEDDDEPEPKTSPAKPTGSSRPHPGDRRCRTDRRYPDRWPADRYPGARRYRS